MKLLFISSAIVLLFLGFLAAVQLWSDQSDIENAELSAATLAQDESEHNIWSPQTEALIEAFATHRDDLNTLRDMIEKTEYVAVSLLDDDLFVITKDGRKIANEELKDSDQWSTSMRRSNITAILTFNGMIGFIPRPPRTAHDRSETINYFFDHPVPAKQCSDKFRDISCGVCDLISDDKWSIRFTWSSGEFEEEYAENFVSVYQDKDSNLSIDEVHSKYDESKKACMQRGLEEMGYENPELY